MQRQIDEARAQLVKAQEKQEQQMLHLRQQLAREHAERGELTTNSHQAHLDLHSVLRDFVTLDRARAAACAATHAAARTVIIKTMDDAGAARAASAAVAALGMG